MGDWSEYLAIEYPVEAVHLMRRRSHRGRLLGYETFRTPLEALAGKPLNRETGRPRNPTVTGRKTTSDPIFCLTPYSRWHVPCH